MLRVDTNLASLRAKGLGPIRLLLQPFVILVRSLRWMPACDVVHYQAASNWAFMPVIVTTWLAKLLRKRVVISYQGGGGPRFIDRFPWLSKPFMRIADVTTVCSTELEREFTKRNLSVVFVHNMFDDSAFVYRDRNRIEPRIVWNRSMDEIYDPLTAVRTFEIVKQRYPQASMVMTSNGAMMNEVRRYLADHRIEGITLPGRVPLVDLVRFMNEADICLNTSIIDGLPTSMLEAAACGLPIVTTPAGGIPSLFKDGESAVFFPFGGYREAADAITELIENPTKAQSMGRTASKVSDDYKWARVAEELSAVYGFYLLKSKRESVSAPVPG